MNKELKPCPFCGGEAVINILLGNYCVTCTECNGSIFPAAGMTEEEAIEAWNTRKPIDKVVERLEEKKSTLERMARIEKQIGSTYKRKQFERGAKEIGVAIEIVKGGAE